LTDHCKHCDTRLNDDNWKSYHKERKRKICVECYRKQTREAYVLNRSKRLEYNREYYSKYREENREYIRAYNKYYRKNRNANKRAYQEHEAN
jgi:hypothetical protein